MSITPPDPATFSVEKAWEPLPRRFWREEEAAHLLRRMGFSATPEAVASALRRPIEASVNEAYSPAQPPAKSKALAEYEASAAERYRHIYGKVKDPMERRELLRELQREDEENFRQFAMDWFLYARQPENSAREKFVLFLQDVFVVERKTVKETPQLYSLQQTLRRGIQGNYRELCKAVSREPAMIRYLNLDRSTRQKPNENFARELFELFTLGEGNYSEQDVKEAARALTGYRVKDRVEFHFARRFHDGGMKTVFGQTGAWDGDQVIDLTFQQPAARRFLVRELMKFYLGEPLPHEDYVAALGDRWSEHDFDLRFLLESFFQSHLFYHPAYRGNLVKSPIQFYLGLCQDLRLDVVPFDTRLLHSLRAMGQAYYDPPNVRGWLYGEHWINSTTISARRQLVSYLFSQLREDKLNGNEQRDLERAREEGRADFLVSSKRIEQALEVETARLAEHLLTYFVTAPSREIYAEPLKRLIGDTGEEAARDRVRDAVIALLQSPAYNLC